MSSFTASCPSSLAPGIFSVTATATAGEPAFVLPPSRPAAAVEPDDRKRCLATSAVFATVPADVRWNVRAANRAAKDILSAEANQPRRLYAQLRVKCWPRTQLGKQSNHGHGALFYRIYESREVKEKKGFPFPGFSRRVLPWGEEGRLRLSVLWFVLFAVWEETEGGSPPRPTPLLLPLFLVRSHRRGHSILPTGDPYGDAGAVKVALYRSQRRCLQVMEGVV